MSSVLSRAGLRTKQAETWGGLKATNVSSFPELSGHKGMDKILLAITGNAEAFHALVRYIVVLEQRVTQLEDDLWGKT